MFCLELRSRGVITRGGRRLFSGRKHWGKLRVPQTQKSKKETFSSPFVVVEPGGVPESLGEGVAVDLQLGDLERGENVRISVRKRRIKLPQTPTPIASVIGPSFPHSGTKRNGGEGFRQRRSRMSNGRLPRQSGGKERPKPQKVTPVTFAQY